MPIFTPEGGLGGAGAEASPRGLHAPSVSRISHAPRDGRLNFSSGGILGTMVHVHVCRYVYRWSHRPSRCTASGAALMGSLEHGGLEYARYAARRTLVGRAVRDLGLPATTAEDESAWADVLSDYGVALNQIGRRREAVATYHAATSLEPRHANAHNNLAVAMQALGDFDGSIRAYASAAQHSPSGSPAVILCNMLRCMLDGARWRDFPLLEALARASPSGASADVAWARLEARAFLVDSVSLLHAAAAAEAAAVAASARLAWRCDTANGGARLPRATGASPHPQQRSPHDPLRVAILSDLDADPSASLLVSALAALHASPTLTLTLLSPSANAPSKYVEAIAARVPTTYLPPTGGSFDPTAKPANQLCEAHAALSALQPHILIEAQAYLPGQQLALLGKRCDTHALGAAALQRRPSSCAPVQTSWLRAFHGSMRSRLIHYTTVDARALPPTTARRFYTERAVLLPHQHLVNEHATRTEARLPAASDPTKTADDDSASPRRRRTTPTTPTTTTAPRRAPGRVDAGRLAWARPRGWPARLPIACSLNRISASPRDRRDSTSRLLDGGVPDAPCPRALTHAPASCALTRAHARPDTCMRPDA